MPKVSKVKKLVLVLATSTSMTGAREETLKRISYIHYLVQFKNMNEAQVQALVDSGSEVNTIYLSFTKQLGLPIRPTDVRDRKIDNTTLDIYGMVLAAFLVTDKANQVKFFDETFPIVNVSLKVVFEMLFFILSNADIDFLDWDLQ